MSGYKEFTGKTLDEAIREACAFFNVEREKLEIEIVNDAKTGIFGLVGAKKATLRARKVSLDDIGLSFPAKDEKARERGGKKSGRAKEDQGREENGKNEAGNNAKSAPQDTPKAADKDAPAPKAGRRQQAAKVTGAAEPPKNGQANAEAGREGKKQPPAGSLASRRAADPFFTPADSPKSADDATETSPAIKPQNLPAVAAEAPEGQEQRSRSRGRGRGKGKEQPAPESPRTQERDKKKTRNNGRQRNAEERAEAESENTQLFNDDEHGFEDQLPVIPLEELDQELLRGSVLEALHQLLTPLTDKIESTLSLEDGRVRIRLETEENQGLIIGRDGQTLSALQYLLSCITSRKLGASVRVQIDAGDYREKQEEKLRSLALALAQKVKSSQRPQSTRPLSAYHRRIIHVTLQDDPDVQTHSKSEGNLKSVVIVPRRKHSGK